MDIEQYIERLECKAPRVQKVFPEALGEAQRLLSAEGVERYVAAAGAICALGRGGSEPVVVFLQSAPTIARIAGDAILPEIAEVVTRLSTSLNGGAIVPFLNTLLPVTRRLEEAALLRQYFELIDRMITADAGQAFEPLFNNVVHVIGEICIGGLKNWMEFGLRGYRHQPHRIADYFSLQTADARAALQRERNGTLYADAERQLNLYLRALWDLEIDCHPFSRAFDTTRRKTPYIDQQGFHLPDVYEDFSGTVSGLDRYRALLAHLAATYTWTRPIVADNFSPFQQLVVETFEDSRVEGLAMQRMPGLRRLWLALHPKPVEGDCPEGWSCIRHKLAILSRALLDPEHGYSDPVLLDFVERFHARMAADPQDPALSTELGRAYYTAIHTRDFRLPKVFFKDTEVPYRDDNRYLWMFLEDTEDEDEFTSDHAAANPREQESEEGQMFARHLGEWDYATQSYRHDWVTVYESIQTDGDPTVIDKLLEKHAVLAKKLKRIVDLLKPQQHVRIRYQEEGDELDLDIAIRSMLDYKSGTTPDPRIHFSHKHDGRDIAVTLLLDLSESINEVPAGAEQSVKELSQEAVSLLAWAIDALGDPFAIGGFASNTRHEVRYLHFKGFNEPWGAAPKARLASMEGGFSTRMGAAIRNAGHYLSKRKNDKRLLLILTDGEPHDIDVKDPEYLKADTKRAVEEIAGKGVATYCITLDRNADEYVADIFGDNGYAVIDHIEKLPEKLPQLFMALTK